MKEFSLERSKNLILHYIYLYIESKWHALPLYVLIANANLFRNNNNNKKRKLCCCPKETSPNI